MPILEAVLIAVAILALLGVIFEEVIHVNKAKTTLFFGTFSWVLLFLFSSGVDETAFGEHCRDRRVMAVSGGGDDICGLPEQERHDRKHDLPDHASSGHRAAIAVSDRSVLLRVFFPGR